jgi:heme/copper-type cytochrome/quinol oxidase subunit 2
MHALGGTPKVFQRHILAVVGLAGALLSLGIATAAQDQAPEHKDIKITAKDYRFSPARVEVGVNDLVRVTVTSEDVAYGFTIDEYRVSKRVPPNGTVTFEFRADRAGTFPFYSSLTSDSRHSQAKGQLIVSTRR